MGFCLRHDHHSFFGFLSAETSLLLKLKPAQNAIIIPIMGSKNQCVHLEPGGPRSGNTPSNITTKDVTVNATGINIGCPYVFRNKLVLLIHRDASAQATPRQVPEPVATPCRSSVPVENGQTPAANVEIPTNGDADAPVPVSGEIRLSENAINLRLHRIMKPNSKTGEYRVADNIRKMYTDKKNKNKLVHLFQSCGFDTDRVRLVFRNSFDHFKDCYNNCQVPCRIAS